MDKSRELAKNTIIIGIGQFIPKIIAMITLPILTQAFSTEQYGTYDLIISFATLCIPIITWMIQQAVFRFMISEKEQKKINSYITNSLFFITIMSSILLVITVIVAKIFNLNFEIIILSFMLYMSESIYDLFGQIARGYGKNTIYSVAIIMFSIVNMLLIVLALIFKSINVYNVIIITTISYAIAAIILFTTLKLKDKVSLKYISKRDLKDLLKYAIPIIPNSISLWIVNLSDRLIISAFLNTAYNGIYSAASKIPNLFATCYNVFNLAWTEFASRIFGDKDSQEYYSKLWNMLYNFLIGCMLLLLLLSPLLYKILIDDKFAEGTIQLPILFIGTLLNCFVSFYGGLYIALKKTKQVGISSTIGAILNAIINIATIKTFGLYAASVSTVISYAIILVYRIIEIRKYIKIEYNKKDIIIGAITLVIAIVGYYERNLILLGINIFIAIIYNIKYNSFIKVIYKQLKDKILKRKTV